MHNSGIRRQRGLCLPFLLNLLPLLFLLPPALPAQTGSTNGDAESPVGAAPVWERELPGSVSGTPFLQAESVVLAIDHGVISSFSRQGTHLWDFNPRSSVTPYITRSPEGTTYVCNTAGTLMAINRAGRELWRLDMGSPIAFPVVIGWDGRVFIPGSREISCRTASGLTLWRLDPGSPLSLAPAPDHAGGIAMVLENRHFLRVDQFGAAERVQLDRTPAMVVPLKSGEQNSYFLIYVNGETEEIRLDTAANPGSRLSRSRRPALPAAPAAAAGWGGLTAVTLRDGRVLLLSGGQIRWIGQSHDTAEERGPGAVTAGEVSMTFDERGIFVFSPRGATAFAAGGRRRWLFRMPEAAGIPALSDEGLLYVCGNDRNIRTYKIDNQVRNIPRSIYGPEPEGSYGLGNPPPSPWVDHPDRFDEKQLEAMFERIDAATKNGQVGEDEPAYTAYLMEMTAGILNTPNYSPVRPPIRVPQRVELIRLLGRIGSRETIPFLANLFYRDPEPSIKAACCEAIGRIGVDPKGDAIRAYSVLLAPDNANLDPMTLIAAASSAAALARFSGPPQAVSSIRLLMAFGHMDFPPRVKKQARQELEALRREGLDKPIE